jgi:hypothetical protein
VVKAFNVVILSLNSIPFPKIISYNVLPNLVEKIKQIYFCLLNKCYCVIASVDLWVFKGAHDVFALVINFLGLNWKPKQIILGLFEVVEITRKALIKNLIHILDAYSLRNKIITYVKDECSNLNTLTNVFKYVVKCEASCLEENFQGTYLCHVFFKACQYATTNEKVCRSLKYIYIKFS